MMELEGNRLADGDNGFVAELTEKEKKLIRIIRDTGYGEVKVFVQDKEPVRVEELKKSIKL